MKLYVLTEEPYHDNSTLVGVFVDCDSAREVFKKLAPPDGYWDCVGDDSHWNDPDMKLAEWDTVTKKETRTWTIVYRQEWSANRSDPYRKVVEFVEDFPA